MKTFTLRAIVSILLGSALLATGGCSRKKAGFTNRLYHNTTTHYNWYFNAREIIRQTEDGLWSNKEDDYQQILPVYVLPDEDGQKNLYPQMDLVIEKCGTAIDRHSIDIKKEGDKKKKEHNKWIDDNFLLLGVANYYKGRYATSQEMFSYTAKKYKSEPTRFDAGLWLARTYIEMGNYNKAFTVLSAVEKDESKDRPKTFQGNLETVYSDLYLRQARYKEAIPHLENAALFTTEKRMKARLTYILGQCHKELGKSQDAINAFVEVVELKPDYEMEFYARINQALSYDRKLDSRKIIDMLTAMSKDEKYETYYDQIYYALAEIAFQEQRVEDAISLYQTSTRTSVDNPRQKGMSFLRLAKIYFDERQYVYAKDYYDSTATYLPEDFPDYDIITAIGTSLIDLVNNLQIVERNDSLIGLAAMDERDREKTILRMIADLEAEEDRKRQEELEALQKLQFQANASEKGKSSNSKTWYFYNTATLSSGFQEFNRRWGTRKLEDNWRRSNRTEFIDSSQDQADSDTATAPLGQAVASNVKTLEEYLAEIPLSDEALRGVHNEIIDALYEIGTIYKENLKDNDNAIESFLRIINEYDTSSTALPAYYQMYRIYVDKEQSGGFIGTGLRDNSEYYKTVILSDYPDSEFAKLILDPDYVTAKSQKYADEKAAYEETYKKYSRRQYSEVLMTCNTVIRDEPNNNFLAKYYLIKALATGARKEAEAYESVLRELIAKFPGTPEAEKASELLGELNDAKARLARESANKNDKDEPPQAAQATVIPPASSEFSADDGSEHFFALLFPKTEGNATTLKETIAQFDAEYFKNEKLRITNSFIDKDNQIIIVRSFTDRQTAMDYFNTFYSNNTILAEINNKNYQKFVITTKNFTVLFRNKNIDGYLGFFQSHYL